MRKPYQSKASWHKVHMQILLHALWEAFDVCDCWGLLVLSANCFISLALIVLMLRGSRTLKFPCNKTSRLDDELLMLFSKVFHHSRLSVLVNVSMSASVVLIAAVIVTQSINLCIHWHRDDDLYDENKCSRHQMLPWHFMTQKLLSSR